MHSVLVDIGQVPGALKSEFPVIGRSVLWLFLDNDEMRHVGTADVDRALDAEGPRKGEYVHLVKALAKRP